MDRREIMKRTLRVNAFWGIGNAGCHDVEVAHLTPSPELESGDEGYIVSVDAATGELNILPLNDE